MSNTGDFVQKFGYRTFKGELQGRLSRIFSLFIFEVKEAWNRSTIGKVILIIVLVLQFMSIALTALFIGAIFNIVGELNGMTKKEFVVESIYSTASSYLSVGVATVVGRASVGTFGVSGIGILIIPLIGIYGSGLIADDRQGKAVELYLSKLRREEYIVGKFLTIYVLTNALVTLPILFTSILYIQAFSLSLIEFIIPLGKVLLYCFTITFIYALGSITASSLVEKRAYASLAFFFFILISSIFGLLTFSQSTNNEFLVLLSPSNFNVVLAYLMFGESGIRTISSLGAAGPGVSFNAIGFYDGKGLEWFHIYGFTILIILVLGVIFIYRIQKMTGEEL